MSEDKKPEKDVLGKIAEDVHTIKNITVTCFVTAIVLFLLSIMVSLGIK